MLGSRLSAACHQASVVSDPDSGEFHRSPAFRIGETDVPGLSIVPAGTSPDNPSELLGSDRLRELLAWARETFDLTVMDSPPLLVVTDAAVLARAVDGTVFVVRAERTPRAAASRGKQILESAGGKALGAVLNDMRTESGAYGRRYGYYYRESGESQG